MPPSQRSSRSGPWDDLERLARVFAAQQSAPPPPPPPPTSASVTARELYSLFEDLDEDDCAELIDTLGLTDLASELLPVLERVTAAAQRLSTDPPAAPIPSFNYQFPPTDDEDMDLARQIVLGCVSNVVDRMAQTASAAPAAPAPAASASADDDTDSDLANRMQAADLYDISDIESESSLSSTEPPPSSAPSSPSRPAAVNRASSLSSIEAPPSSPPVSPPRPSAVNRAGHSAPPTPQRRGPIRGYNVDTDDFEVSAVTWLEAGALAQDNDGSAYANGTRHRARKARSQAYVVFVGGEVGVMKDWGRVARAIKGHGPAIHKGYPSLSAAQAAFAYARAKGWVRTPDGDVDSSSADPTPSTDDNPLAVGAGDRCLNIIGVSRSLYASFPKQAHAEAAFAYAQESGHTRVLRLALFVTVLPLSHNALVEQFLRPFLTQGYPYRGGRVLVSSTTYVTTSIPLCTSSQSPYLSIPSHPQTRLRAFTTLPGDFHSTSHYLTTKFFRDPYTTKRQRASSAPKWSVSEHCHALTPLSLTIRSLSPSMGRKPKYTQSELQDRRAQSAWEYRQRNRSQVNEKAKLRMQATRAKVRAAAPAIQLGYAVRAAKHRRDYLERRRRGIAQKKLPQPPTTPQWPALTHCSDFKRPDNFYAEEDSSSATEDYDDTRSGQGARDS
ncbi:hypothetical protein R3P38DRAFT_2784332 [Favolaschia claudopus]|uniref:Ribonuclease H1 N-terminal domain-containing protein n=1 Tax=Favolaschia claudopus TaxID=2862362 RepID=A0AAW0AY74_9AGAR